jgi:serine/threonine protein kinase/class 3 adenylate cyclase/tetratricopeptide (TPR) repeat protein
MSLPTESQWAQYSALRARLQAVPASERAAVLQALLAEGHEDPQVLSLVALHWALPPDPSRDRTGDRLGDFTLEEPLGAGGMGVVYRAQQHIGSTTRPVAVKLIHPTLLRTAREETLARFQAEIGTLVKLEHEGIARIYGGGIAEDPHTHEPLPYLAMELVRGGLPITTYARDYALSWQERLGLFVRVCRAVQYAHEHRVIHRDLKPTNILVDREGCPFVIDFGLAHAYDALLPGAHLAASGTPAYMSPEQVSDAFGPISAKSDVYALGLILYELLTAQHPYALLRDGTFAQWCQAITEAPPSLPQSSEVYGGELEEIMAAALAKRPADRVRVDVLRSRLERYLQKLPPDRDRPRYAPSQLPRDTPAVSRQDDRVITPVEVHPRAEVDARLPTAPHMPMPAERKESYGRGELLGSGDAQRSVQAKNRAPPFVGRRQYLDWFDTCFQEVHAGRPRVVFLTGEPGIGKTRLLRELRGVAQHQGFQVWAGRCYEDMTLPYLPFTEALLAPLEQLPAEVQHAFANEAAVLHQFLRRVSFTTSAAQAPSAEEADQDKRHVFLAVSRILIALAQHSPLLLLLDDLHWADSPSLDLLNYVVFSVAERALREQVPLTIVGMLRPVAPEERLARLLMRLQREEVCHTLDLLCLQEAEVHALLQGLGLTHPSHQLVATVMEATQGNPLFIQEVVQYLLQQDVLRESGGYLVTTVAPADLRLPEEVTGAIARRIQDLGVPCQRLLTLAACLGERFAFDTLAAVSGESEETLLSLLEEGMQHRLLLSREQAFQFAHPLVRQVFYHVPSVIRRQHLHHRIARTLEQVYAEHLEEHTLEIAHHLIRAGPAAAPDTVVAYARRAGDQACSAFAWGEAARYYEAASSASEPSGHLSVQERAALHYWAGLAYYRDRDVGPCLDHYEKAIEAYRLIGDLRGLAQVLMEKARTHYTLASVPYGTMVDVQPLEDILRALGESEPGLCGRISAIMAQVYWTARQTDKAEEMAQRALEIGQRLRDDRLCAEASCGQALARVQNLHMREALQSYQNALSYARRADDLWLQGWPLQRMPLTLTLLGRFDEAEAVAREAYTLTRKTHDWADYSLALSALACVAVARGDFAVAERHVHETMLMVSRSRYPWGGARALFALACARARRGAWAEAEDALDILVEPGRIFADVGPVIQTFARAFRQLLRAHSGSLLAEAMEPLAADLRRVVASDPHSLAAFCVLVELGKLLAIPTIVEFPYQVLSRALEREVLFSLGWVFLIPRVLGVAATLQRRWDTAEAHFQAAIGVATSVGARPELALTYLDYAHMLAARGGRSGRRRAIELVKQAGAIFHELGMEPFARRAAEAPQVRVSVAPRPRAADPGDLSAWEVEVLRHTAQGRSSHEIADDLMLSSKTVARHMRSIFKKIGVKNRTAATAYALEKGLASQAVPPPLQSLHIILVTDMQGSTALIRRLGDAQAHELLGIHNAIIRDCLREHRGDEILHTGDGIEASFPSVSSAVACAVAIQKGFALHNKADPSHSMRVRIGINAGEPIVTEERLFGTAVHTAFRICTRAQPGQILVSDVVHQLAAGKGFIFVDRGRVGLKGLPGRVRLYEVQWEDEGA